MAIQLKGEIQTKSGALLVLNYQALCEFEEMTSGSAFDVFNQIDNGEVPKLATMRDFVLCCLRVNDPDATRSDAYSILNEESDAFYKLIQASMPKTDDTTEAKKKTVQARSKPTRK